MTSPESTTEARLRRMFGDAASHIHPTKPAPVPGSPATPWRTPRATVVRRTVGLAVCAVVAVAVIVAVHPWGTSGHTGAAGAIGDGGALLTVESNGAVDLLAPDTGDVLSTIVGPSPVDSAGRHLGRPYGVVDAGGIAYIAYEKPSPVIESVPLSGGTLTYVTDGMDPAVSSDGTQLAFVRLTSGNAPSALVIRDLTTGSERTVDTSSDFALLNGLSWSADGTQLALSGVFLPTSGQNPVVGASIGVQLLALDLPLSSSNPHFLGTPESFSIQSVVHAGSPSWSDPQFLGSGGDVAVLDGGGGNGCQSTATRVLSVDATTGDTTTVATFPFPVSKAVFDPAGNLVAYVRDLPPSACRTGTTTTTTSTTSTTMPGLPGVGSSSFSVGTAFIGSSAQELLYKWSDGTSVKLTRGVVDVAFVPPVS